MAEEIKNEAMETNVTENQDAEPGNKGTPTVEELMAKLSEKDALLSAANARADKNKTELDKALKENGALKKEKRASMTEADRLAEEKAEADRIKDEKYKEMEQRLMRSEAEKAYKSISDENMVNGLIEAISDADHSAVAGIIDRLVAAKVKEAQAEWQKSRPRVNIGGGDVGYTKEQFEKMTMAEKSKLYRENKAEYDRLNS